MNLIFDVIGGLVSVGMKAYQVSQANEEQALAMLEQALVASAAKVRSALEEMDVARKAADAKIAAGWKGNS